MGQVKKRGAIPELCRRLLKAKGLVEEKDIEAFLYPKLKDLPKPSLMKGLAAAVGLVVEYIDQGYQIVVWGDYDVDGTTSTGLLVNFFKEIGVEVIYHIPNRLTEGYGLNTEWFKDEISSFKSRRFLLITVDCGIANSEEIEVIKGLGGDVVVTDHHSIPLTGMPNCCVLNPAQQDCGFHEHKLAGVGVAFYLAAGIRAELAKSTAFKVKASSVNLKNYLAFVALGTVADLVEITTTNRILVRAGLESLLETPFEGLAALLTSCGLFGDQITSEDIGFLLGPKINAAGRLGKSSVAIELFVAVDSTEAKKGADRLERLNLKRKSICEVDFENASRISSKSVIQSRFCCICSGEYHLGVAGIVASRLVDEFKFPAIVFAENTDRFGLVSLKGSVRSVEGISVIQALNDCADTIVKFGGHDMAAGLTIRPEDLDVFARKLSKCLQAQFERLANKRTFVTPVEASVDQVMDRDTLEFLNNFEPFGPGNVAPVFRDRGSRIVQAKTVGKGNAHLNVVVRGEYANYKGIGFNLGDKISAVQESPERTISFVPTKNRYRGTVSWQLRIVDLQ
ncbi:MAG: single-stranded-DNA-specific exonuclease RecJ [Desulfotalea sp.]|nr:MAG: single-stranded-DNA-specific exonuclease RecJ [Desulfotalea sp.]